MSRPDTSHSPADKVAAAVDARLRAGLSFYGSQVAAESGLEVEQTQVALLDLVSAGRLEMVLTLIDPITGAPLERYRVGEPLPLGQPVRDAQGLRPIVKDDIVVSFRPTRAYLEELLDARPDAAGQVAGADAAAAHADEDDEGAT